MIEFYLNQEKDNEINLFTIVCIRMFEINWEIFLRKNNLFFILFQLMLLEQIGVSIKTSELSWTFFEG